MREFQSTILRYVSSKLQIILLQEIPQVEPGKRFYKRLCDRLILDTERSAELEGSVKGIHAIYFLEDFAKAWTGHVSQLQDYVGITYLRAPKPPQLMYARHEIKKSPWLDIIDKCDLIRI